MDEAEQEQEFTSAASVKSTYESATGGFKVKVHQCSVDNRGTHLTSCSSIKRDEVQAFLKYVQNEYLLCCTSISYISTLERRQKDNIIL